MEYHDILYNSAKVVWYRSLLSGKTTHWIAHSLEGNIRLFLRKLLIELWCTYNKFRPRQRSIFDLIFVSKYKSQSSIKQKRSRGLLFLFYNSLFFFCLYSGAKEFILQTEETFLAYSHLLCKTIQNDAKIKLNNTFDFGFESKTFANDTYGKATE